MFCADTGAEKEKLVKELGAEVWVDFATEDVTKSILAATNGLGAHAAVVTSASSSGYEQAIDYLREGGTLVAVGLPGSAKLNASIFFTVLKSINIVGSYVGNRQDAIEAMEIAATGAVKCIYQKKPLSELKNVYRDLEGGKIAGRIVLNM